MHKLKYTFLLLLTFLCFSGFIIAKADNNEIILSDKTYYDYFDTVITIQIWDYNTVTDKQWQDIEDVIKHIQETFRRTEQPDVSYEKQSELYKLNQTAGSSIPFYCSDDLFEVIKIGFDFAKETNGKFDPAIGPLVDLWGIPNNPKIPTKEEIDAVLPLVDYTKVVIDETNQTVTLPQKGMIIDLGAIAKGFAADKISEYLLSQNIKHAMINLGGNILAYGDRYSQRDDGTYNWAIGIRDPKGGTADSIGVVYLTNKTVVSSGTYERFFTDPETGKIYHHILDPKTGYPVDNNLSSVSIITTSSTDADALSTSIFAMGIDDGKKFLKDNYPEVEAIFITKDNDIIKTSGVDTIYHFKLLNSETTNNTKDNIILKTSIISVIVIIIVGGTVFIGNKYK